MSGEDSSGGERIYNWNDIRREVMDYTPKEGDFTDCYSEEEIAKDQAKKQKIKEELGIKEEFGISDSRIQEYATTQDIGEMDWFGEDKSGRDSELFPDGKGQQVEVFLSSEYDDMINHVDAICTINNADTDFKPVPFALDMTYNTNAGDLDKKMSWRHPFRGVGVPGFATVKYFEDAISYKPEIPKGRISIMPRFVVGFDPDLSTKITEFRMTKDGWDSLGRDELSAKAKWCVLSELEEQSGQMLEYLEEHHEDSELLEEAYSQVKSLNKYFAGAIEAAREMDAAHPERENYVKYDEVAGAIMAREII